MKSKMLATLFLAALMAGCATAPPMQLTPGAEKVQVAKSDPSDNYEIISAVTGTDGDGCGGFGYTGTYERAIINLRNVVFIAGGDYAQIYSITEPHSEPNCYDNQYVIHATAYKKVRSQPSATPIIDTGEEDLTKKLRELKKLLDEGVINREEFEDQKRKLLERGF